MADTPLSSYVVLRQAASAEGPPVWIPVGTVNARSQTDAIKDLADKTAAAVYTAVPARSWQPVKVTPSTVTTFDIATPAPTPAPAEDEVSP